MIEQVCLEYDLCLEYELKKCSKVYMFPSKGTKLGLRRFEGGMKKSASYLKHSSRNIPQTEMSTNASVELKFHCEVVVQL